MLKVVEQIKGVFVFRLLSVFANFWFTRLLLNYYDQSTYGLWAVFYSIVSWFVVFDVGIVNGLRFKISELAAKRDLFEINRYVSSAFFFYGASNAFWFLLLIFPVFWVDWGALFGVAIDENQLSFSIFALTAGIFVNQVLKLARSAAFAFHLSQLVIVGEFLMFSLPLAMFLVLAAVIVIDFFYLSVIFAVGMVLSSAITMKLVWRKIGFIRLESRFVSWSRAKSCARIGLPYFLIQICAVVIFSTDRVLIAHFVSPADVAEYDVIMKLLQALNMFFLIIMTPMWSTFSEAYLLGKIDWIIKSIGKLNMLVFVAAVIIGLIVFYANDLISLWLSRDMDVSLALRATCGAFMMLTIFTSVYSSFINGVNKLGPQLACSLIGALTNVPLSYFFGVTLGFGSSGIVFASVLALLPFTIVGPIQTYALLKKNFLYAR